MRVRVGRAMGMAVIVASGVAWLATIARAQGGAQPAPAVQTASVSDARARAIEAAVLGQVVSLRLEHVTLSDALAAIAERSGIGLQYIEDALPNGKTVSLVAERVTVGDALAAVLNGTGLVAVVPALGRIRLQPSREVAAKSRPHERQQGGGIIAGHVADAKTGQPLAHATLVLEGTGYRGTTRTDGQYAIERVPSGSYILIARILGYAPQTRRVDVTAESIARIDFALTEAAATLEQVVTTGAGPQRRVELGNAVATIGVDSVARTAPVTNLTDVISGRAPGVEVVQTNGLAGSGPAIRIRGRGSVTLPNDPIYIVDGVRIDGSPAGQVDAIQATGETMPTASRLNDLDPSEIESLEVLRGPSASTEYGTDAANGVVVITTKRGHVGAPRWSATAEEGLSMMPVHFPDNYYSWGHSTSGTPTQVMCPLVPNAVYASLGVPGYGFGSTAGTCAVDSVTRWQPLNHSATSLFGTGTRGQYELQVSGGGPQMQYFFGGGLTNEVGALQMPHTEVARLARERGEVVPRTQVRPNALADERLRSRVSAALGGVADVSVSAAYLNATQRSPNEDGLLFGALESRGVRDSLSGYSANAPRFTPGIKLSDMGSEGVNRFTGGLSSTWRPAGWLSTRGTVGLDDAGQTDELLVLPGQGSSVCNNPGCSNFGQLGYRSLGLYRTDFYTVDLGATAALVLTRVVSAKTAVGLQYNDRRVRGSATAVTGLALGNPTLNGGAIYAQIERHDEAATLGSYAEETVGIGGRLFLVGAVRVDAGSGFGTTYKAAAYPKASVSWVVLPEGEARTALRLRAAYGQAGVQPPPGSALQLFVPTQTYHAAGTVPSVILSTVGSPGLKPERTEEVEGGFDLGLFGQRVTMEATGYSKVSHDALVSVPLAASLNGGGTELINLGSVRNRGIEASVTARVLDARVLQWDVTVSGSDNENRLVTLGSGVLPIDQTGSVGPYKQQPGYPLYGQWAVRVHYHDLNRDGIIESNEVTQDSVASFIGPSLAPRELAVNTGVTLFRGRLRLGGQLDHRGGQYLDNVLSRFSDIAQYSRASNDARTPLARQAQAVAAGNDPLFRTNAGYIEPASFTRLRELSLTYFAPGRLAAALHAQTLSATVAGRNLAVWTKYTGSDPEVNTGAGLTQVFSVGRVPTTALNPDRVVDFGSVPQMRYWTLKVNVSL